MLNRRQFLHLCGGVTTGILFWCSSTSREPNYTVVIRSGNVFEPAALTVPAGSMVAWHNRADQVHTVTADPGKAQLAERVLLPEGAIPFDSGNLFSGDRWIYTFDIPGTYAYFCQYHEVEEMLGVITVTARIT